MLIWLGFGSWFGSKKGVGKEVDCLFLWCAEQEV